jgi:two-component system cell cycle response regulator DivK
MTTVNDMDFSDVCALVVEDDAGGVAILSILMRYLGIRAYVNKTGQGVVEMGHTMHPPPTIVLLDINLPRTSGYEVLEEIRADDELKDVIVVAVTAQDADTEIPKCKAAGFDAFIGKPISRKRFPRQLRRVLDGESVWETY